MPLRVHYTTFTPDGAHLNLAESASAAVAESIAALRRDFESEEVLAVFAPESFELYLASDLLPDAPPSSATARARELEILQSFIRQTPRFAPLPAACTWQHAHGQEAAARFFRSALGWLSHGGCNHGHAAALRQAHVHAQNAGAAGPILNHLYERALWLAEKVRLETGFFEPSPSLATAIIEIGGKIFGGLQSRATLLVGDNTEAAEMASALAEAKAGRLYYVPQAALHGEKFAQAGAAPAVLPAQQQGDWQPSADVVVIFENSSLPWHDPRYLHKLMQRRNNAPLLLVDLSSAPARKDAFDKIYNLYYFSRQDLNRVIMQQEQARQEVLREAAHWIDLEVENFYRWVHSEDRFHFGAMVGKSPAMQHVFEWIARLARTDITVLIQGESGTGKELVAKAVHDASARAQGPFVVVNCGAIPENLLESELFGHVRGAFTGAIQNKKGLFEEAHTGTIFLDEIGELPAALQVKLLRFLQDNEIKRVGSNQTVQLEVRVIAASNRDLHSLVAEGKFRSDLYYRLNVVQIDLPPLRQRPEDIPILARHFLRKFSARMRKSPRALSAEALQKLQAHQWPGNVRELENAMERAVALSLEPEIGQAELPENIRQHTAPGAESARLSLKEMERRHIIETLEACHGNYDEAARVLGIGRTTLWRKLKEYQVS